MVCFLIAGQLRRNECGRALVPFFVGLKEGRGEQSAPVDVKNGFKKAWLRIDIVVMGFAAC